MKKITKIEHSVPYAPRRKKVAAYARVSRDTENLMRSVSAQISYYSALIQSNPEWEYAGVYADRGITGTLASKRDEFLRMLDDCENGKIDIILTKSISRFARNTVELLETVRHLKTLGIDVRFEKEHINSLSEDGEVMLSLLASFAQEESRSISENCKWGIRKRFQSGEIGVANKRLLGYRYDEKQRKYVIVPDEAEHIRWMFQMYIDGVSLRDIADSLNNAGIRTILGNKFLEASVRQLIFNEVYAGDIKRQKCYNENPISKNKVPNRGQLPQYYIPDCHEAIIDRETYKKVLEEMERRTSLLNPTYCFTGKIRCAVCGSHYSRVKNLARGKLYVRWVCRSKKEIGQSCESVNITEHELKQICAAVLDIPEFDEDIFNRRVKDMLVKENGDIEFQLDDRTVRTWKNLNLHPARSITTITDAFTNKIICAKCGNTYHRVNSANRWVYWYCMGKKKKAVRCDNINYTDYQLRQISAFILGEDEFNADTFNERIRNILVLADGSLEYEFYDGGRKTWRKM